jgi:hypothetical protein
MRLLACVTTKITTDGRGGSRFEEVEVPQASTPFAENDVDGQGHVLRVVSPTPATMMFVPIAD